LASAGVLGITKKQIMPKMTVMMPSTVLLSVSLATLLNPTSSPAILTEEDPWPLVVSVELNLRQSGGEQPAESTGHRGGAIEQTTAVHHLMSTVEHGEVDDYTTENTALKETEEHAAGDQAGIGFGKADAEADEAPSCDERREVDTSANPFEDPVARHVDENVGNVEDEEGDVEHGSSPHIEVLGETGDLRITDIAPVDEGEQPGGGSAWKKPIHVRGA
jgi:hypothetical protein